MVPFFLVTAQYIYLEFSRGILITLNRNVKIIHIQKIDKIQK